MFHVDRDALCRGHRRGPHVLLGSEPAQRAPCAALGEGESLEAARQVVVWTRRLRHHPRWAMYALMGMAFGYFAYRFGMPLSIRSRLYPILGKRIHGVAGDAVGTAALLGTVGVATSLESAWCS
ncbi:BCCT family transporter [Kocuria rhizophila]|nr:BCCT family transporter [Kocuria rhizophila]